MRNREIHSSGGPLTIVKITVLGAGLSPKAGASSAEDRNISSDSKGCQRDLGGFSLPIALIRNRSNGPAAKCNCVLEMRIF